MKQNQIVRFEERQIEKLMIKTRPTQSTKTRTPKSKQPTTVPILPLSRIVTLLFNKLYYKDTIL